MAVPIGNIEDLSSRARDTIKRATRIFCEDTRKVRDLLERAQITSDAKKTPLPGDREESTDWEQYFREDLEANSQSRPVWVLVSDAGSPVWNDPGAKLMQTARDLKWSHQAIPGPSAPVLLVQWHGGFGLPFVFAGFVPKGGGKDLEQFFSMVNVSGTFCFFETKHHIRETFEWLKNNGFSEKQMVIGREMTKAHEELLTGTVNELAVALESQIESGRVGELSCLLQGEQSQFSATEVGLVDLVTIRNGHSKEAARVAAKLTNLSTRDCYNALLGNAKKDSETE